MKPYTTSQMATPETMRKARMMNSKTGSEAMIEAHRNKFLKRCAKFGGSRIGKGSAEELMAYVIRLERLNRELLEALKHVCSWLESKSLIKKDEVSIYGFNHHIALLNKAIAKAEGR